MARSRRIEALLNIIRSEREVYADQWILKAAIEDQRLVGDNSNHKMTTSGLWVKEFWRVDCYPSIRSLVRNGYVEKIVTGKYRYLRG